VHFATGTYTSGYVETHKSGLSANQKVVFLSDTKWGAKLVINSGAETMFRMETDFAEVVGFEVTTSISAVNQSTYGFQPNGSSNSILSNRIHDIATSTCADDGGAGIASAQADTNTKIIGNSVFNIGPGGANSPGNCRTVRGIYMTHPAVIQNNLVYRNSENGIDAAPGSVVSNNTVFNNGGYGTGNNGWSASSPLLCCQPGTPLSGIGDCIATLGGGAITITNNICINNGASNSTSSLHSCGIYNRHQDSSNALIANNLIRNDNTGNNAAGGIACGNALPVSVGTNPGGLISSNLTASPNFVNYQANGGGDYHLQLGSLAISAGTTKCALGGVSPCTPTADFDGVLRPAPLSLGAYETLQSSSLPDAPSGLTALVQ